MIYFFTFCFSNIYRINLQIYISNYAVIYRVCCKTNISTVDICYAFDMCVALDIFLLYKNSIYSAKRNDGTFHHSAHIILTNKRLTTAGTTHHRSAELNQKSKYIARLKVLLNKNLTKWRSPSLSAKADRDEKASHHHNFIGRYAQMRTLLYYRFQFYVFNFQLNLQSTRSVPKLFIIHFSIFIIH